MPRDTAVQLTGTAVDLQFGDCTAVRYGSLRSPLSTYGVRTWGVSKVTAFPTFPPILIRLGDRALTLIFILITLTLLCNFVRIWKLGKYPISNDPKLKLNYKTFLNVTGDLCRKCPYLYTHQMAGLGEHSRVSHLGAVQSTLKPLFVRRDRATDRGRRV